jgi:transposase-like protein
VIPFFAFPEPVRRIIYPTNAIEALHAKLRRAVRTRGHFPTDDAATKLLFFVLHEAAGEWKIEANPGKTSEDRDMSAYDVLIERCGHQHV